MLTWHEPELHISSFQGKISVCATFPDSWLLKNVDCDVQLSSSEIQFSWDEFGWRQRAKLPFPAEIDTAACRLQRRQRQVHVELRSHAKG